MMKVTGTSDLGRLATMQNRAHETRDLLNRASIELSTGENSSRYEATSGNLTRLFALERSLERNDIYNQTIGLTEIRIDMIQTSIGKILKPTEDLSVNLLSSANLNDIGSGLIHAQAARHAFKDAVATLNTQAGGLSLFAGTATDGQALASAETILAELDTIAQGAASASDAITAIRDYFTNPTGDFYTNGYLGSTDDIVGVDIGESRRLDYSLRADNARFVAVLQAQALAAVVAGGAFAGDPTQQKLMLNTAGKEMINAKDGMLLLQADVGVSQAQLDEAKASRVAEKNTFDLARNKIMAIDDTEVASMYQALGSQLETIYTVTARLAKLSYAQYIS